MQIERAPGMDNEPIPEPVQRFADWMDKWLKDQELREHPENYSMAHLVELQEKAREFGLVLHPDGVLEVVKEPAH